MIITKHPLCNAVLGAPAGHDHTALPVDALPIVRARNDDGVPWCISFWQPTEEEIASILAGEPVALWVMGATHSPVSVRVGLAGVQC